MIKKGTVLVCVRRKKLPTDSMNYAKKRLIIGDTYVVEEVLNYPGNKRHYLSVRLEGSAFKHKLNNFILKKDEDEV